VKGQRRQHVWEVLTCTGVELGPVGMIESSSAKTFLPCATSRHQLASTVCKPICPNQEATWHETMYLSAQRS
jgi:hypothetical protein